MEQKDLWNEWCDGNTTQSLEGSAKSMDLGVRLKATFLPVSSLPVSHPVDQSKTIWSDLSSSEGLFQMGFFLLMVTESLFSFPSFVSFLLPHYH